MQTVNRTAEEVRERLDHRMDGAEGDLLFLDKDLRDEMAARLRRRGIAVRKESVRGPRLHPEYIADYTGTYETGFGNEDYLRTWRVLYRLAWDRESRTAERTARRRFSRL